MLDKKYSLQLKIKVIESEKSMKKIRTRKNKVKNQMLKVASTYLTDLNVLTFINIHRLMEWICMNRGQEESWLDTNMTWNKLMLNLPNVNSCLVLVIYMIYSLLKPFFWRRHWLNRNLSLKWNMNKKYTSLMNYLVISIHTLSDTMIQSFKSLINCFQPNRNSITVWRQISTFKSLKEMILKNSSLKMREFFKLIRAEKKQHSLNISW